MIKALALVATQALTLAYGGAADFSPGRESIPGSAVHVGSASIQPDSTPCSVRQIGQRPLMLDLDTQVHIEPEVVEPSTTGDLFIAGVHNHVFRRTGILPRGIGRRLIACSVLS